MQPSSLCIRCQLRLLRQTVQSSQIHRRRFVSVRQASITKSNPSQQDDIIPPKEKEFVDTQLRSTGSSKKQKSAEDDSVNAILALFDATRHRQPSSTTSRYSRRAIYPQSNTVLDGQRQENDLDTQKSSPESDVDQPLDDAGLIGSGFKHDVGISEARDTHGSAKIYSPVVARAKLSERVSRVNRATNSPQQHVDGRLSNSPSNGVGTGADGLTKHQSQWRIANSQRLELNTNISVVGPTLDGLSREETEFHSELDRIQNLALQDTGKIQSLLASTQNLQIPSQNDLLRDRWHSTIQMIASRVLSHCNKPRKLPTSDRDLPLLIDWYRAYEHWLGDWYLELISKYLEHFWKAGHFVRNNPKYGAPATLSTNLQGIVVLWKRYLFPTFDAVDGATASEFDANALLSNDDVLLQRETLPTTFSGRMLHFFPAISQKSPERTASLVSLTCALIQNLSKQSMLTPQASIESEKFLSMFSRIMHGADFDTPNKDQIQGWNAEPELLTIWTRFQTSLHEELVESQSQLKSKSIDDEASQDNRLDLKAKYIQDDGAEHSIIEPDFDMLEDHDLQGSGSNKSTRKKDQKATKETWLLFRKQLDTIQREKQHLAPMFAEFLWSFAEQRNLELVNAVWTTMIQRGVQPKISHWNAILEILQKNRDFGKYKQIWQDMLRSGCQPNNTSWTNHIVILLQEKQWTSAVHLINDMGAAWKQDMAANPSLDNKSFEDAQRLPSIIPINAAITGLLRLGHADVAQDVLKWARDYPLAVDATTYNIFLLHECRRGNVEGAAALLENMQKDNVQPDVVTRTIVLDSEIRDPKSRLHSLSPSEQEEAVLRELQLMTDEGQSPNAQTFAVVLHSLLHVAKPNLPAANAVFRLLLKQKQSIPPHIYTIVFTHYFKSQNPNLDALDSLWNRLEREKTIIDQVLYDKMIEGYASIGEIGRMMAIFKRMVDRGHPAGWLELQRVLSALVRQRRWDLCADFVSDALNDSQVGKRGWRGKREFSQLVRELQQQNLIPVSSKPSKKVSL